MRQLQLLFACIFITGISYGQRSDIMWMNPSHFKPISFLKMVRGETKNFNFITISNSFPEDWVTKKDVDRLIKLISSKEKCKCVVNPLSSYLPRDSADLGGYAILFVKSFKEKKKVDIGLYRCPHTNNKDVEELKEWWRQFNK